MVGIVAKGLQDALHDFADLWEMMAKYVLAWPCRL